MSTADVITLPFRWGAALRHRKVFHPDGVVVSGALERVAPPGDGLPVESGPVLARFSKGVGLPGGLPDIAGLAWRTGGDADPWDLLAVSVAPVPLGRVLLAPLTSWVDAVFSSLMPLRYDGAVWWVRARLLSPFDEGGLSLDSVARRVVSDGIEVSVEQARGAAGFEPLARMTLTAVCPDADVTFDPVRHEADDVRLTPGWLTGLRRAAYSRSREGRR